MPLAVDFPWIPLVYIIILYVPTIIIQTVFLLLNNLLGLFCCQILRGAISLRNARVETNRLSEVLRVYQT